MRKSYRWVDSRGQHREMFAGSGEFSGASWYSRNGYEMDLPQYPPGELPKPYYINDLPEFVCGMTGKLLSSRSQKREVCARTGFVDWEPIHGKQSPKRRPDGYGNRKVAEAAGLPYNEDVEGWLKDRMRDQLAPVEMETRDLKYGGERGIDARGTAEMVSKYRELGLDGETVKVKGRRKGKRPAKGSAGLAAQ